jgi:predicted enzyme related to lactoylglutathione lyase
MEGVSADNGRMSSGAEGGQRVFRVGGISYLRIPTREPHAAYIFVESVDETLERVVARRGEVATEPYPEGDLWVAAFRDPAGNVVGVWQQGPRDV